MSRWAKERKTIVTLSLIVIFLTVGIFLISKIIYVPPSCTDGIQNQSERGVDCGGPCETECRLVFGEVDILWTTAVRLAEVAPGRYDSNVYALIALIENQNTDLVGERILYEFVYYDENGNIILSVEDYTNIMPGGITPIFYPGVETGQKEIDTVDLRFPNGIKFKNYDRDLDFSFSDFVFENSDDPRASAKVVNNTLRTIEDVEFVAVIQDEEGNTIATARTGVERIGPKERKDIFFTWVNKWELYENKVDSCLIDKCYYEPENMSIYPLLFKKF